MRFRMKKPPVKPSRLDKVYITLASIPLVDFIPKRSDKDVTVIPEYFSAFGRHVKIDIEDGSLIKQYATQVQMWSIEQIVVGSKLLKDRVIERYNLPLDNVHIVVTREDTDNIYSDSHDITVEVCCDVVYIGEEPDFLFEKKLRKYEKELDAYNKWLEENKENIERWNEANKKKISARKEAEKLKKQKEIQRLKAQLAKLEGGKKND